ncbi:MAG: HAMP domain-containing protein [Acidobacteria bacterium]|nr:HAMP domain-containing protein [Acidobacteriota bacterium]MBI3474026.1 HAMP domain-containing protein [Candidatus Solibacter usitatus]
MMFRTKLLVATSVTVAGAVGLVSAVVAATARTRFEKLDETRRADLVRQFRREFARRGEEVTRRVERLAAMDAVQRLAGELSRPEPDYDVNIAQSLAAALSLDFVELVGRDGRIYSSAQWPARFGYRDEWVQRTGEARAPGHYLKREELPEDTVLAVMAVREVRLGDAALYAAGGLRIDREFLSSLTLPDGMRVLLHRDDDAALARLAALAERVKRLRREASAVVDHEVFQAIPLAGREEELLGVLLVASSRREIEALQDLILWLGLGVGGGGVLFGVALSWWITARVTRPVRRLAGAAGEVAGGNWNIRVDERSGDEIGELARAFNQMTRHLIEQRERLVQSERVAAWRELARRLAHELKNPLFPLQITVENMQRAREQYPEQFEEVFRESVQTLLAELANLKAIVGRFSDFAKMPPPERQPAQVNDIVRGVMKLFQAQFAAASIATEVDLAPDLPAIQADSEQLHRALQNLVLNALDAMPSGGTLRIQTGSSNHTVHLKVADTGSGLTKEECERLFTPYYTTKQHGTGLGLAIVQSVVSDHGGSIAVQSEIGKGTLFRIDLPAKTEN